MKTDEDELTNEQAESTNQVLQEINAELKDSHQWLDSGQKTEQPSHLRGDEYLQEMGEPLRAGFNFVGRGEQIQSEIFLNIGLSAGLKSHIASNDWRGDEVCLLVGKHREAKSNQSHWVAIKPGQWPQMKNDKGHIDARWEDKKTGKFSFVISKEFVKNFRTLTSKDNQRLYLKVTFGTKATAGKIWVMPNSR